MCCVQRGLCYENSDLLSCFSEGGLGRSSFGTLAAGSVVSCTGLVQKHVTPATADLCVRLFLLSGRVQTS